MKKLFPYTIAIVLLILVSCKERFEPPVVQTNQNLLVVDGFLNISADTTTIRLSRTRRLSDGTANSAETNSQIMLEDDAGNVLYYFQEMDDGNYIIPGLNLEFNKKYRLRINTSDGKQYASDEIEAKQTPLIDSITWEKQDNGVMIFANTHDPQNNTRYYRWDYTNTWEYHSAYYSFFKFENNMVVERDRNDNIYQCWTTKNSTELLLGSSARLTQDIINKQPIRFINLNAIELFVKYSIVVRQYANSAEGHEYLQNLKKITEQLGSIFDAQPSQLTGNIHSVNDPKEPVLGFITASSVNEKRIFIDHKDVVPWNFQLHCQDKIIVPLSEIESSFGTGLYIPISQYAPMGALLGYYAGDPSCVDCRVNGGVNIKPDFWP